MNAQTIQFPFLTAILVCCAAGLAIILLLPPGRARAIKWVSAVCSGLPTIRSAAGCSSWKRCSGWTFLGIYYFNAADGFNLPMLLLTGIVFFTGVLTMWELELRVKEFFALYFLLVSGCLRTLHEHGSVLHLRLVRRLALSHVPADRRLGHHPQRIRRHEADPLPSGGQRPDPAGHHLPGRAVRPEHLRHQP
jgi:hypothetical protein